MTGDVLRGGARGDARSHLLAAARRPSTRRLLRRAGIAPGMVCLDPRRGSGEVTPALARLVGPRGTAAGIDLDGARLRFARADAARERLANVAFQVGDAALDAVAGDAPVSARPVPTQLREPQAMVRRMVRAGPPAAVTPGAAAPGRGSRGGSQRAAPPCPPSPCRW